MQQEILATHGVHTTQPASPAFVFCPGRKQRWTGANQLQQARAKGTSHKSRISVVHWLETIGYDCAMEGGKTWQSKDQYHQSLGFWEWQGPTWTEFKATKMNFVLGNWQWPMRSKDQYHHRYGFYWVWSAQGDCKFWIAMATLTAEHPCVCNCRFSIYSCNSQKQWDESFPSSPAGQPSTTTNLVPITHHRYPKGNIPHCWTLDPFPKYKGSVVGYDANHRLCQIEYKDGDLEKILLQQSSSS